MDIFIGLILPNIERVGDLSTSQDLFCTELIKGAMLQFSRLAKVTGINNPNVILLFASINGKSHLVRSNSTDGSDRAYFVLANFISQYLPKTHQSFIKHSQSVSLGSQ